MDVLYFDDEKLDRLSPERLKSLVDFVKEVWDPDVTIESYLAGRSREFIKNPFMKESGSPLALLVDGDRVVGHCRTTPCKIWAHGKEWPMYWCSGLHLMPELRGKKMGHLLTVRFTEELDTLTGFFVIPQQLKTHANLGWEIPGKVPDYIRLINPKHFFKQLDLSGIDQMPLILRRITETKNSRVRNALATIFSAVIRSYYLMCSLTKKTIKNRLTCRVVIDFDDRVDELWKQARHGLKFSQVRNAAYMNWQFKPDYGWKKIIIEEDGELVGFSLISIRNNTDSGKLSNMKLVSIIDLFWDFKKPYVVQAVLEYVDTLAKEENADLVFCSITEQTAIQRLKKNGYLQIPGTVYFTARSTHPNIRLSGNMDDWFLTRADADAAGSLSPKI